MEGRGDREKDLPIYEFRAIILFEETEYHLRCEYFKIHVVKNKEKKNKKCKKIVNAIAVTIVKFWKFKIAMYTVLDLSTQSVYCEILINVV